jgi:acetoin utilization deacetylase AcuC-like enzyme
MGFCLFNSVAIAARHLTRRHGARRLAIVDWDVHHGNGTQDVFYDDGSVLFVSLHQDDLYPKGSGTLAERGGGAGEGATVNVPLPAGTGDEGYRLAFERVVDPAVRRFEPEFLLLSAGQDAAAADPLGRMSVTTEGFRALAASALRLAREVCDGRLVAFQEGGYSVDHVPLCNLAILEALAELSPAWERDPMELDVPAGVSEATRQAVEAAARAGGLA